MRLEGPQQRNGGHGSPTIPRVQAHTAQSVPIVQQINGPVDNQPLDDPTSLPLRNPSQEHIQDTDMVDGGPSLTRSSSRRCNPGLRRFRLSRSYSDIRDDQVFSTNKSVSKPRPTLALFEERDREYLSRPGTSEGNKTEKLTETSPLDSESEFNLSSALVRRKPPGPNFRGVSFESIRSKDYAEAQHDYVGTSQGNGISEDEVSQDSALVKEMQEMALEILEADRKTRVDYETAKTQPTNTGEASYAHGIMPERDFVYETYLRCPIDEVGSSNGNESSDAGKYGILVVDEADEDLWNTHATSDEDTEWDEDDPDSNGTAFKFQLMSLLIVVSGGQPQQ